MLASVELSPRNVASVYIPANVRQDGLETVWFNGHYLSMSEAKVPIEDRAMMFGDGIYEVLAAYQGVPFLLEEHLDRWERSAEGLQIKSLYDRTTRRGVVVELLHKLGKERAMVYGQLTRGVAPRTHAFPHHAEPTEFWFARELPEYPAVWYRDGVQLVRHPDERWARCWIKSTCLLPNVLSKQHAINSGAFDSLLVADDNIVRETSAGNVYCVRDGVVFTHPTNERILGGCTRNQLIKLARGAGIEVREEKFRYEFFHGADETFVTSTTVNVLPVTRLDGHLIGGGRTGEVTLRLMELLRRDIAGKVEAGLAHQ